MMVDIGVSLILIKTTSIQTVLSVLRLIGFKLHDAPGLNCTMLQDGECDAGGR